MEIKKMHDNKNIEKFVLERQKQIYKPRYEGACLSMINFDPKYSEPLKDYLNKPSNFLVYLGNPGIGKTFFCAALTEWAMKKMAHFRYYKEQEILSILRNNMQNSFGGDYSKLLENLIDDDLIIIDDVGSSGLTEWREEVFFNIIDYRYNTMKPTIITSNFSRKDFYQNYSPRIGSRLFSIENLIIEIENGTDLRSKGF